MFTSAGNCNKNAGMFFQLTYVDELALYGFKRLCILCMSHRLLLWCFFKTFLDGKVLWRFFRISSAFYRKSVIQVWKGLMLSKWWQNARFWLNYGSNIRLVVAVQIFLWGQANTQIKPVQGAASQTLSRSLTHMHCASSQGSSWFNKEQETTTLSLSRDKAKVKRDSFFSVHVVCKQDCRRLREKAKGLDSLLSNEVKQNGWQATAVKQLLGFQRKPTGSCEATSDSLYRYWICSQQARCPLGCKLT